MKVKEEKDEVEKLEPGQWCQDPKTQPLPPCPHLHNNIVLIRLPHDAQSSPLPPPSDPKNDRKQTKVRGMRVILIKQDAMSQRFKSRRGNRLQTKNLSRYLLISLWKQMRVLAVTRQSSEGQLRQFSNLGSAALWQDQNL